MPATGRAESSLFHAIAANAKGKLAPHRKAAGRMAQSARRRSSSKATQGPLDGDGWIGPYGRTWMACAAQAIARVNITWHQPNISRGCARREALNAAAQLPIPIPTRNTARMMENVYTVAPSISDTRRVQITSAPSAQHPDSAMVTWTSQVRETPTATTSLGLSAEVRCGCLPERINAVEATNPFSVAATTVALTGS